MAKSLKRWLDVTFPDSWDGVFVRSVITGLVAFVALVLKEWMDTREWDVPACAVDATWIAGGALVLNAILKRRTPG